MSSPEEGPGFVPAAGDDDDVSGAGELQCPVDALVVAGAGPDGEGRAGEAGAGPDGLDGGVRDAEAVHGVADVGGGQLGEAFHHVPVGAGEVCVDGVNGWELS